MYYLLIWGKRRAYDIKIYESAPAHKALCYTCMVWFQWSTEKLWSRCSFFIVNNVTFQKPLRYLIVS